MQKLQKLQFQKSPQDMKLASKGPQSLKMDPSKVDQTLTVGFLNILGQTKLKQPKQNQIQFIMQEHKIDILHLQETNISEGAFDFCPFIALPNSGTKQ